MTQILYKQKSSIQKGETIRGMNFVSPLVEYKFYNQNSEQIYKKYFIDSSSPVEGTFTHIADVNSDISDEIKKTVKNFYYYGKEEPQFFAYRVIVFSSTGAIKLKECFEVSKPLDNEILIFVEDNKHDSASGTYGAIKISPKIIATLNSQNRLAYDVKDNKNIYDELKKIVPELSNDQIKSLLHNGYIEDTRIEAIKTWLKIASFFSSGIEAILPGLGILTNDIVRKGTSDILGEVIEKIEEVRLEEYRWQPKAPKTDNGETDKNYRYQPLLSVDEKDNATVNIAQFANILQKMLDEQKDYVKSKLKISKNFDEKSEPNGLLEFLYNNYLKAYKVAKSTISQIQELSDFEILKYGVKAYNALLCGVWNGLVDAVSGLFAMVKMIYDGITLGKDFVQNIDKYLPTLLEQFDEAIQAIEKLNFTDVAKYIYGKLKEVNLTFDPIAGAYFIGYAYGFILSLIIEIILTVVATGATLTIPVIVEKLSEVLFGIFRLGFSAVKGIAKAIRTFSKFVVRSIEDVIKGFQEFLNFLKKGWDEIKKIIDDTFEVVKDAKKKFNQAKWEELQKYLQTRNKFHNIDLVEQLWKKRITSKVLFPNQLKSLYFKYLEEFPALKRGFNQAEFKTTIKKKGKLIEEVEEFSVSGNKKRWSEFGDPPELPPNTINVLDDWENFEKFVEGAVDFSGGMRKYDSEIKYIFNFLKNHMNRGDEFIIETRNIFKTCGSCKREFVMLEDYLRTQGKKVKIIVFSDETVRGTEDLKVALKLKKKK